MYVEAYETSSNRKFFIRPMDNVCNRRLFSVPSKVEMAEEHEYLQSLYTMQISL